jgi:hypothetical protein
MGNECDDLMGDALGGPSAGAWKPSLCLQTINCILQTRCADPSVFDCYCGQGVGSGCTDSGLASGGCLSTENAGLETTDIATALGPAFASKSLAAGVANAIFLCAAAHQCATCLAPSSAPVDAAASEGGD